MDGNSGENNANADTRRTSTVSTGQKLKGAAEVLHGIGENLRGRFLDAFEDTAHPNAKQPRPEVQEGRLEAERGFARMKGEISPGDKSQDNIGPSGGGVGEYDNAPSVPGGAAMNAGLGAGAGVTPGPEPYPGQCGGGMTGSTGDMTAQGANNSWDAFGGAPHSQNNKDFHPGYSNSNQGYSEGPGPAMGTPPGNDPQRLP